MVHKSFSKVMLKQRHEQHSGAVRRNKDYLDSPSYKLGHYILLFLGGLQQEADNEWDTQGCV